MRGVAWLLSLLVMAAIWLADSLPSALPAALGGLEHAALYALLTSLLSRASGSRGLGLALALWFGAACEVHLALVPGRTAGIQNWLEELAGGLLVYWLRGVRERRAQQPSETLNVP
ncbi:VanZ family protein [Deinococcus sp.]|uniref:VanZ family protein n=1 Tax=Deinococcus sp. TaxID=47478 RepID=UPI003CC63ACF